MVLKYNKTNPFTLSVENNYNFDFIYIEQNILMDEANNTYPDSLTSIPIERSENNLIITNNKSYGQLSGLINNINLDVMIEATNIDEDISYLTKSKNMNFYFDSLKPGNYKLRAFEILNNKNDSIYFSGKINPYQRAAKFAIYPEIISIRSRWEIEGIDIRF